MEKDCRATRCSGGSDRPCLPGTLSPWKRHESIQHPNKYVIARGIPCATGKQDRFRKTL